MRAQSADATTPLSPMLAEDYWPEPIDVDFDDDAEDGFELEDWPLDEDVRRLVDVR